MHKRTLQPSKKGTKNVLGKRLREIREAEKVTHVDMLRLLHESGWEIDPAMLSRIENGQRILADYEVERMLEVLGKVWADLD